MSQTHRQSPLARRAFRFTRVFGLAAILVTSLGAAECGTPDEAVIITYKPVAAFNGYVLTGHADPPEPAGPGRDWVYYRISSIVNLGRDAKTFTLDFSRIWVQDDDGENKPPMSSAQLWGGRFPSTFVNQSFTVAPKSKLEFPMGQDAPRFIVWQSEGTGYQRVRYDSNGAPQPVTIVIEPGAQPQVVDLMDSHQLQLGLK